VAVAGVAKDRRLLCVCVCVCVFVHTRTHTHTYTHTHTQETLADDAGDTLNVVCLLSHLQVLSDAHAVAQRKLDAILAGQHM